MIVRAVLALIRAAPEPARPERRPLSPASSRSSSGPGSGAKLSTSRQLVQPAYLRRPELGPHPFELRPDHRHVVRRLERPPLAVAADPGCPVEPAQQLERLPLPRAAEAVVAPEEEGGVRRVLREHGLERRAVNVVQDRERAQTGGR